MFYKSGSEIHYRRGSRDLSFRTDSSMIFLLVTWGFVSWVQPGYENSLMIQPDLHCSTIRDNCAQRLSWDMKAWGLGSRIQAWKGKLQMQIIYVPRFLSPVLFWLSLAFLWNCTCLHYNYLLFVFPELPVRVYGIYSVHCLAKNLSVKKENDFKLQKCNNLLYFKICIYFLWLCFIHFSDIWFSLSKIIYSNIQVS